MEAVMNRPIAVISICVVLVCLLVSPAIGKKPITGEKQPGEIDRKSKAVQTEQTTRAEPAPTSAGVPGTFQDILSAESENLEIITPPENMAEQGADAYAVPWKSINGGGGTASTPTHRVSVSIGQALIGRCSSPDHAVGIGYWYGIPTAGECFCGDSWGDLDGDALINPVDVVYIINYVYKFLDGRVLYETCPIEAGDVDCNTTVDAVDVVYYLNYVYKNVNAFCADPCTP